MIVIAELDAVASARLDDAKALLAAGRIDGAAYLCGYAVEIALKARICRALNWSGFPSTGGEFAAYRSFQTHDLDVLLRLSGQETRVRQSHLDLWNSVVVWNPESRYDVVGKMRQSDATAMIEATRQLMGVL